MSSASSPFNAARFPLQGQHLIEASAGTGKTYNIANLYLRLLLGDDCEPKTVDQILVVTFTRAATDELRGRIRDKVEQALQVFRGASGTDHFIQSLFDETGNREAAARRLNYALLRMDEACIFTIHGFAVRVIQTFLFETGALANVEISEAGNVRRDQMLADLWRHLQLTRDKRLMTYVQALDITDRAHFVSYFSGHHAMADIKPPLAIKGDAASIDMLLKAADKQLSAEVKTILDERTRLAGLWQALCSKGEDVLKAELDHPQAADLIKRISAWMSGTDTAVTLPGKTTKIFTYMLSFVEDGGAVDNRTKIISDIIQHAINGKGLPAMQKQLFRAVLLQHLRARMTAIDMEAMQLDEVISLINNTLQAGGFKAAQLRSMITHSYPVCMVDEFQDTDPAQFEMFRQLYSDSPNSGFFMIGDPKQSIYQFRGADIFSYLAVRKQVAQPFSLDTNFRSKKEFVAATNCLFSETARSGGQAPTFIFPGIAYIDVKSCESEHQMDKGRYTTGQSSLPTQPLVFIGNNSDPDGDEKLNGDHLRWQYANDAAQRIAALLNTDSGGKMNGKAMRGGDIAVLVRTGREASAMRAALLAQRPAIASVYQSQRDNVFRSSLIAADIYHLLCAMDEPKDKALLKAAMVTLLYRGFKLEFSDLDALASDDETFENSIFENLISEFDGYRKDWESHGVLSALDHFISRRALMTELATLPDCDRLVTDLRHIGELLQSKYLACSSRQELLAWYAQQLKGESASSDEDQQRIRLESDDNLVKIVTIHVSKGLEYPVVFLPFFFLPRAVDIDKAIPLYHPEPDYHAEVDFSLDSAVLKTHLQKERLAEDMRLLYVAITRAIFQCYIGISAATSRHEKLFPKTVWAHLLGIDHPQPDWSQIQAAVQDKFSKQNLSETIACRRLFDSQAHGQSHQAHQAKNDKTIDVELMPCVQTPALRPSHWVITSYSALAHARKEVGRRQGGADETADVSREILPAPDETDWADDIRYRLLGSSNTGDCLHGFFEQLALEPVLYLSDAAAAVHLNSETDLLLQRYLRKHGLEKPEGLDVSNLSEAKKDKLYRERRQHLLAWIAALLQQPLAGLPPLQHLLLEKQLRPELEFDFALGRAGKAVKIREGINKVLKDMGVDGISLPPHQGLWRDSLEGLMTGSIDLLFIHNKKVYVLDYKSNTLGKSPSRYDQAQMSQAMRDNRYDLQYLIYSVAAHRYMQQRLQGRYSYDPCDDSSYSFGGVFYLFLRGMGFPDHPEFSQHGVWFQRPAAEQVLALNAAFGALS